MIDQAERLDADAGRPAQGPVLVLVNADAGTVQRQGPEAVVEEISAGCDLRGLAAVVRAVGSRDILGVAEAFLDAHRGDDGPPPVLVVGGGDGTLGTVAGLVAGRNAVLGVLPLGTLNHFARDLGVPLTLAGALDVVAAGDTQAVDVGDVNGRSFVNNSSVGVYPYFVAARTSEQRRRGVGKREAILPAILRTLRSFSWHRLSLAIEGDRRLLKTPCIFVGNNYYDIGALGRRQGLSDGKLCIYVVKPQTWRGLLALPVKAVLRLLHPERDVELFLGSSATLRSLKPRLRVAVDGESLELPTPLTYRIREGALTVLAPQTEGA